MTLSNKEKTHDRGVLGETAAELFLRAKGFSIIERRYKTPHGEIDLIALDGEGLVFIEVKARQSAEEALYAITAKARGRISAAAGHFIANHKEHERRAMRFDVVAVKLPFSIQHVENAWMAGE